MSLIDYFAVHTVPKMYRGKGALYPSETVYVNDIKIQAILVPGHTLGHMAYLIDDKYLFHRRFSCNQFRRRLLFI